MYIDIWSDVYTVLYGSIFFNMRYILQQMQYIFLYIAFIRIINNIL